MSSITIDHSGRKLPSQRPYSDWDRNQWQCNEGNQMLLREVET